MSFASPEHVVFVNGLGTPKEEWADVAAEVATLAPVVLFDRMPAARPVRTRSLRDLVAELSAVVDAASPAAPVLLVAHSWGGAIARRYAALQPERVAGLVLVDTTHEEQDPRGLFVTRGLYRALELLSPAPGAARLLSRLLVPSAAPAGYRNRVREIAGDPTTWRTARAELLGVPAGVRELRAECPTLPDVPVAVLVARGSPNRIVAKALKKLHDAWRETAAAAPRATFRIVEDTGHYISLEQPAAVVAAVHEVLAALRPA